MFALLVRFEVLPEHDAAFDDLVADTIAQIAAHEPGTVVYVNHLDPARPSDRVFYEAYVDREAFYAHEASEHTKRFLEQREQHLAREPIVTWLTSAASNLT